MKKRWRTAVAATVTVLAIIIGWRWWASDERAIRKQMSVIAQSLTVAPNERELGPVTRIATLRKTLAPEIRIVASPPRGPAGEGAPQQVVGRDAVLALVSRWIPPPGGVTVEFVEPQATIDQGRVTADVSCTVKVTSHESSSQPTVDAREVTIGFSKIEGAWLVASVRADEQR